MTLKNVGNGLLYQTALIPKMRKVQLGCAPGGSASGGLKDIPAHTHQNRPVNPVHPCKFKTHDTRPLPMRTPVLYTVLHVRQQAQGHGPPPDRKFPPQGSSRGSGYKTANTVGFHLHRWLAPEAVFLRSMALTSTAGVSTAPRGSSPPHRHSGFDPESSNVGNGQHVEL